MGRSLFGVPDPLDLWSFDSTDHARRHDLFVFELRCVRYGHWDAYPVHPSSYHALQNWRHDRLFVVNP